MTRPSVRAALYAGRGLPARPRPLSLPARPPVSKSCKANLVDEAGRALLLSAQRLSRLGLSFAVRGVTALYNVLSSAEESLRLN